MSELTIKVKQLPESEGLPLPERMTTGSSGFDLYAAVGNPVTIEAGDTKMVPTGLVFMIPENYEVQIRPRSGLAAKYSVTVLNSPGTVDADYRGEVKVILINHGKEPFTVQRGDRIAQAVPCSLPGSVSIERVSETEETGRDSGGFGHTGR